MRHIYCKVCAHKHSRARDYWTIPDSVPIVFHIRKNNWFFKSFVAIIENIVFDRWIKFEFVSRFFCKTNNLFVSVSGKIQLTFTVTEIFMIFSNFITQSVCIKIILCMRNMNIIPNTPRWQYQKLKCTQNTSFICETSLKCATSFSFRACSFVHKSRGNSASKTIFQ